ncbi:MAG: Ig-like domain-containing protein [Longimicrobiales bacterium]
MELGALGAAQQLEATVKDQRGALMVGAEVIWSSSGPQVATVTTAGLVTAAGNGTTTIKATSGTASASALVTVRQVATALVLTVPPSTTAKNRVPFEKQPAVQLRDAGGHPVATAGVAISASVGSGSGSGASLGGTTVVPTAANGEAAFSNLVLAGTVGSQVITFAASGLSSATASLGLTAGAPSAVTLNGGDQQSGVVGLPLAKAPSVKVVDLDANPVPAQLVAFSATSGGGHVDSAAVITNSTGIAAAGAWTMGSQAIPNTLEATVQATGVAGNPVRLAAYAFPPFFELPVLGEQSPFATGVTFNWARDRLVLVHPWYGVGELSPEGGQWIRYGTSAPGNGHAYIAVHEASEKILMMSAQVGTYSWDYHSGTWKAESKGDAPSARDFAAMVYDQVHQRVLLYGGIIHGGSSSPVGELYSWDGDSWTRLPDPPAGRRAGHDMALDPATGQIFVHGGVELGNPSGGQAVRDTWVIKVDGTWEKLPSELPRPLAAFCMAYNEQRGSLVVMGGTTVGTGGYGLSNEVWERWGGEWRRSPLTTPVGVRALCSLAYVPSANGMLLYGSEHAGWNDVWFYGIR